jgi:hypothetical protein
MVSDENSRIQVRDLDRDPNPDPEPPVRGMEPRIREPDPDPHPNVMDPKHCLTLSSPIALTRYVFHSTSCQRGQKIRHNGRLHQRAAQ